MKRIGSLLLIVFAVPWFQSCTEAPRAPMDPPPGFYAYHTDLNQSKDPFHKYKDLVVVLGEGRRLEFSREQEYRPRWVTPNGNFLVDEFFPDKDSDKNLDYTYVRLLKSDGESLLVHRRYIPDIKRINGINEAMDPVNSYGFQAAVHELYMISRDGTVKREMRDARNTRREDWLNPITVSKQSLHLKDQGIEHGEIHWGKKGPFLPRPAVEANPLKVKVFNENLLGMWTFDEGMKAHEDQVREELSQKVSRVDGSMTLFKKGISGTSLAFDGYYTGVSFPSSGLIPPDSKTLTVEAWIALDVYPYNDAAVVHQSTGFGESGYYLGIDPFGHVIFRVDGAEVKSQHKLKYGEWAHIAGRFSSGKMAVIVNGEIDRQLESEVSSLSLPQTALVIGRNTEKERCTDYVREFDQNITFLYGIQGLIDEIKIYETALSDSQLAKNYAALKPGNLKSDLAPGVLPGAFENSNSFGASYESLKFSEVWDGLWRNAGNDEIVVRFADLPTSVIFWKGTNYAANWVTDNNRWFADQSSEIWGPHGCSEHMADKQNRMCYARVVESSPARVVIHWRYPCVDVGYNCEEKQNWSDEYHTIYPDGTGVRKVYWNGDKNEVPGFQDIQMLTNPGESALDVVHLQALSMANRKGETVDLTWNPPNIMPDNTLEDADIEWINSKSEYKVFMAFQGACFTPWGAEEQSAYTEDPFAGPWNHWPMHLVPSDGRYVVDKDRVSHFALAANDCAPEFESMVLYGFTKQKIDGIIPTARSWQTPPRVSGTTGGTSQGFDKVHKAFEFRAEGEALSFTIESSVKQPVIHPCFVLRNWKNSEMAQVWVDGQELLTDAELRQGIIRDVDGTQTLVVWASIESDSHVEIKIL